MTKSDRCWANRVDFSGNFALRRFCFISILLYTIQVFHHDFLDFYGTGFKVVWNFMSLRPTPKQAARRMTFQTSFKEIKYSWLIQNGGSKMADGSRSFFNNKWRNHDITATVKDY